MEVDRTVRDRIRQPQRAHDLGARDSQLFEAGLELGVVVERELYRCVGGERLGEQLA